ncbi:MAG: HD domain-containing protein [bacterium]
MKFLYNTYKIDCIYIRDPIYGYIETPKDFIPIISQPLFQRLRWISQAPLQQMVYPSAMNSRFEHSLGTMYLSMKIMSSLINNSPNKLAQISKNFSDIEVQKNLLLTAGLCGLLHDVGHGPFSHTLEYACDLLPNVKYDHETIGLNITKQIFQEISFAPKYLSDVINTLNKSLDFEKGEISPISKLVRSIIDGVIDADKGDYLLRDSYHCGVGYGKYDIEQLWDNVALTEDFSLGVLPKGAIEAWTLRFCRYKMYSNVYKHHIRDITDALLSEIIFEVFNNNNGNIFDSAIFPVDVGGRISMDETFLKFSFWTDETFISELFNKKLLKITSKIQRFRKRDLYKRAFEINLLKYYNFNSNKDKIIKKIIEIKNLNEEKNIFFNFIHYKKTSPPVFGDEEQVDLKVIDKDNDNKEESLAKYLDFELDNQDNKEKNDNQELYGPEEIILKVFMPSDCKSHIEKIKKEIENILETEAL